MYRLNNKKKFFFFCQPFFFLRLIEKLFIILFRRGNCRKAATGQPCDFGLRTRIYHVLSGSVLSVWSKVESVLVGLNAASRMQIIRLRTDDNQKIVGMCPIFNLNCSVNKMSFSYYLDPMNH